MLDVRLKTPRPTKSTLPSSSPALTVLTGLSERAVFEPIPSLNARSARHGRIVGAVALLAAAGSCAYAAALLICQPAAPAESKDASGWLHAGRRA